MPSTNAKEVWKDVPSFPNYQVSTLGRIRSKDTLVNSGTGLRNRKGKILKTQINKNGYMQVTIYADGKRKVSYVHDLVLRTFRGAPMPGQESRHLNSRPLDCKLRNLKWATRAENFKDKQGNGTGRLGHRSLTAKLNVHAVVLIRLMYSAGVRQSKIYHLFGINDKTCSDVCTYKTWNPRKWVRDLRSLKKERRQNTDAYRSLLSEAKVLLLDPNHPKHHQLLTLVNKFEKQEA